MELKEINQRQMWVDAMLKIGKPFWILLSKRQLKETLPSEFHKSASRFAPLRGI